MVLKGSNFATGVSDSIQSGHVDRRNKLIENNKLVKKEDKLVLMEDYEFESPSTAAGIVLGRSANGRTEWKTEEGKRLSEIMESTTEM
ncbi:DUF4357 domain-containing protein [Halalkalibacter lacteus]|uniref:DUF4357 domain-containing protein n=1 Tax=Halalkalibacter lacteus TaxID=3090663 RepID=UPI002FC7AEC9